jgi:hypothetical protein
MQPIHLCQVMACFWSSDLDHTIYVVTFCTFRLPMRHLDPKKIYASAHSISRPRVSHVSLRPEKIICFGSLDLTSVHLLLTVRHVPPPPPPQAQPPRSPTLRTPAFLSVAASPACPPQFLLLPCLSLTTMPQGRGPPSPMPFIPALAAVPARYFPGESHPSRRTDLVG